MDFTHCNSIEFALDQALTQGRQVIDKKLTFDVIVLVLHYACRKTFQDLLLGLEIFVLILNADTVRPWHFLTNAGDTQAAFRIPFPIGSVLQYFGIDKGLLKSFQLGKLIGHGTAIDHKEANGETYLRCRQSHSVGMVHGFPHILVHFFKTLVIGSNFGPYFTKHWVTIYIYR